MLRELRLKNFAIIDELSVDFKPGFNVLTGETGAGKSILIGALGVALGERAYAEMIKTGSETATVEAFFDGYEDSFLNEIGIKSLDGVVFRRIISLSGKTKAYINDSIVSVQSVAEQGRGLLDIHGQHEHQSLLQPENQLKLLDRFGGIEGETASFQSLYRDVEALRRKADSLMSDARERARKIDLLGFQINEIKTAALLPREDEELDKERSILVNLNRLNELTAASYELLYNSEGACLEKLQRAEAGLREVASIDGSVGETLNLLESALPLIEDASVQLRDIKEKYDADPGRLSAVEDRLELIRGLKKKYGDTVEAVLKYMEDAEKELGIVETAEESLEALKNELSEKEAALGKLASEISEKRKKTARKAGKSIGDVLKELAMGNSEFRVNIKDAPMTHNGTDSIEFLFSANPGEMPKSLSKVASGGELSRIMLAIKTVLREADDIPVLIFDEVDAGIGGKTAQNVAAKLRDLSKGRQVLCITHLPQIASLADAHFLIEKYEKQGKVGVTVRELLGKERHEEIARMLSGTVTETSLKHAKEIIKGGPGALF